jgi:O-antigen/teichoic acid export membrane protein
MNLSLRHHPAWVGLRGHFGRGRLGSQAGWVTVPFAAQQIVRLGTNVILAALLAPEMFGLMLLINTLRTGVELLSDIGIGQSVVRSPNGEDQRFLDTAWTLQLMRGLLLAAITVAAAVPLGAIYGRPELVPILLAVSPVFLFTGLQSPGLFLVQRHMRLRARAAYDLGCTVFQCAFTIALAWVMPTVWALVWGLVVSTFFSMVMSYLVGTRRLPSFAWDRRALGEILHFGKWIFLSTIVYFAATSTDRMYFVAALPLALAGVYAIARTFAELFDQLAQRAGALLIFPKLAAMGEARGEAAARLRAKRRLLLALVAVALGGTMAVSDRLILLLYDDRYLLAAFMLPVLFAGVWFRVLGAFADAMLMGCGRPAPGAAANTVKFAVLLIGLPLALTGAGVFAALLVLIVAEAARWLVLAPILQGERLASVIDDVVLTLIAAGSAVAFKLGLGSTGLVPTLAEWWALGQPLHG